MPAPMDIYGLSDSVWKGGQGTRDQIAHVLTQAIATGEDALVTAKKLEQYLDPAYAPIRNVNGKLVRNQQKGIVTSTPGRGGMGSFAARRLARTEFTAAHGDAMREKSATLPYINGIKWNLSNAHPVIDECDDRSQGGPNGDGVYPGPSAPDYPAHPQCLCFLTTELTDQAGLQKYLDTFIPEPEPPSGAFPLDPELGGFKVVAHDDLPLPPNVLGAIDDAIPHFTSIAHEEALVFDANGNLLLHFKGDPKLVGMDAAFDIPRDVRKAGVNGWTMHNHPDTGDGFSHPFSSGDFYNFAQDNLAAGVVVNPDGSIIVATRPAGGWGDAETYLRDSREIDFKIRSDPKIEARIFALADIADPVAREAARAQLLHEIDMKSTADFAASKGIELHYAAGKGALSAPIGAAIEPIDITHPEHVEAWIKQLAKDGVLTPGQAAGRIYRMKNGKATPEETYHLVRATAGDKIPPRPPDPAPPKPPGPDDHNDPAQVAAYLRGLVKEGKLTQGQAAGRIYRMQQGKVSPADTVKQVHDLLGIGPGPGPTPPPKPPPPDKTPPKPPPPPPPPGPKDHNDPAQVAAYLRGLVKDGKLTPGQAAGRIYRMQQGKVSPADTVKQVHELLGIGKPPPPTPPKPPPPAPKPVPPPKTQPAPKAETWDQKVKAIFAKSLGHPDVEDFKAVGAILHEQISTSAGLSELAATKARYAAADQRVKAAIGSSVRADHEVALAESSREREVARQERAKANNDLESAKRDRDYLERELVRIKSEAGSYRDEAIKALRTVRPGYGQGKFKKDFTIDTLKKDADRVVEAMKFLPKEWVNAFSGNIRSSVVQRGSFNPRYQGMGRSGGFEITTSGSSEAKRLNTMIHELTHYSEFSTQLPRQEKEFYKHRTGNQPVVLMSQATGNRSYGPDEKTIVDKFVEPYMGKDYGDGFYELMTMATQSIFAPADLALSWDLFQDEEMLTWALGVLAGGG